MRRVTLGIASLVLLVYAFASGLASASIGAFPFCCEWDSSGCTMICWSASAVP